jgi:hypothetical protein
VDIVHPEEAITIFRTVRDFKRKGGLMVRPIPKDVFINAYRLCFSIIQTGIAAAELNENREEADRLRGYCAEILEEGS